jgi:hypothetical protein
MENICSKEIEMIRKRKITIVAATMILLVFSACAAGQPETMSADQSAPAIEEESPDTEDNAEESAPQEAEKVANETPPDPQDMTFTAADGTQLNGIYYPAAFLDAPLVVLMHWAPGDQYDMAEIAYWLQNRGLGGVSDDTSGKPWLAPSWFPAVETEKSYAVFSFTFRDCEDGCSSFLREEWLDDAQSAVEFAYNLDGIDQQRIIMVGASIGADGAADGCLYLNEGHSGSCLGAFSLSPGSYLTVDYPDAVQKLNEDALPAWCLYDENDPEAAVVCSDLVMDNFTAYQISGGGHGLMLVRPDLETNSLELLLDFIDQTIG